MDAYTSESHYADHLLPVWKALPDRGRFYAPTRMIAYLEAHGIAPVLGRPPGTKPHVLVASFSDLRACRHRPAVLIEHGAGQTYSNSHASYSGGDQRDNAVLFLCPNETVARRNRERYPSVPSEVVGCPKLDPWHRRKPKRRGKPPVVAVVFHWDCRLQGAPEARWAFPHFAHVLPDLVLEHFEVLGHGHPRAWRTLERRYQGMGIEPVKSFDEVLERADLLIGDNSSVIFEFASTHRPVVLLNAPWYRKNVSHGLRFWDQANVGLQVDEPRDLVPTVYQALAESSTARVIRESLVSSVYSVRDGSATKRAAAAIERTLSGGEPPLRHSGSHPGSGRGRVKRGDDHAPRSALRG